MWRARHGSSIPRVPWGECPACGRFLGWLAACPYCDADSAVPASWRTLRRATPLLGLVGLAAVAALAAGRPAPRAATGGRDPARDGIAVRVAGAVAGRVAVRRQDGAVAVVAFDVDDGSGPLPVVCRGAAARALAGRRPALAAGARLRLGGRLDLGRARGPRLVVDEPANVQTAPGAAPPPAPRG